MCRGGREANLHLNLMVVAAEVGYLESAKARTVIEGSPGWWQRLQGVFLSVVAEICGRLWAADDDSAPFHSSEALQQPKRQKSAGSVSLPPSIQPMLSLEGPEEPWEGCRCGV